MTINALGIAIIKMYEKLRLQAYKDAVGKWTIGWGHLIKDDERELISSPITKEVADWMLDDDVEIAEDAVSKWVTVELEENQFSALVSFTFNVGEGALRTSTLLKALNKGMYNSVPSEMRRWVFGEGQRLPGLIRRRELESFLFQLPQPVATFDYPSVVLL